MFEADVFAFHLAPSWWLPFAAKLGKPVNLLAPGVGNQSGMMIQIDSSPPDFVTNFSEL